MLDIVGAITLTALAVTVPATLILTSPLDGATARRIGVGTATWFIAVAVLAAVGLFSTRSAIATPAIGAAVLTPVIAMSLRAARAGATRQLALGIPLAGLVAVHGGRLLGAFFLVLHADGRLPRTFALSAGWGDIVVGALALPLAWAVHRRAAGWRPLTLTWNMVGFVDLLAAVTLGVGSAASPLRFLHESPDSGVMGTLPWLLVPGFLVPLYLLAHLAIFVQLRLDATGAPR